MVEVPESTSLQREVMTLILRDNVAEKSAVDLNAGHLGGHRQEGEVSGNLHKSNGLSRGKSVRI